MRPTKKHQGRGRPAIEDIAAKSQQLRQALRRATIELEHKRRELGVEASLERVRMRAMAMRRPEDLLSVCEALFKELHALGFSELRNAMINIHDDERQSFVNYDYSDEVGKSATPLTYDIHPVIRKQIKKIRSGGDAFSETSFTGRELQEWRKFRRTRGEKDDPRIKNISGLHYYLYSIGNGSIGISTFSRIGKDKRALLRRFRNVFDFAYRRYTDVVQAEAQAREAQIETALERVRSKTMSMHNSEDVGETVATMFDELLKLGIRPFRCGVGVFHDQYQLEAWTARPDERGKTTLVIGRLDMSRHPLLQGAFDNWKRKRKTFAYELKGKDVLKYFKTINTQPDYPAKYDLSSLPSLILHHDFYFPEGTLYVFTLEQLSPTTETIFKRFASVFGQTYRRYLDLRIAEAQAREAQIETALERVRSRTMAMHKSDELSDTSFVLFKQLKGLGEVADQMSIGVYDEEKKVLELYATIYGNQWKESGRIPYDGHVVHRETHAAWKKKRKSIVIDLSGKELDDFNRFKMETSTQYKSEEELPRGRWVMHIAFFSKGMLTFSTHEPRPPETVQLLERFAAVFDLTYTRFLDLKKAEAQAREALIEASLERVRSKAMAMHSSGDLSATVSAVFTELRKLGVQTIRAGVALYSQGRRAPTFYAATTGENNAELNIIGSPDPSINPCLAMQYEAWQKQENYSPVLSGDELKAYYNALSLQPAAHSGGGDQFDHEEYGYYLAFSEGNFYAWSEKEYTTEEVNILNRFKLIIDLTFRRYLDLQKAEAQARESQIEASLERVRSRTLAMQKSDELADTAAVLFKQLITLGIEPNRLYIAIMKDDNGNVEFWITDEDGSKVSSAFHADLLANRSWKKMFDGWKEGRRSLTIDMQGEELREYFRHLNSLHVPFKGGLSQNRRVQSLAYFSRGFIGMASPDEQPEETTALLERFAAVLNLTFTRFNDLKLAEAHAHQAQLDLIQLQAEKKRAEDALSELSATQAQLVQQEKLASLGQLTAGIAHEIKNPLNFVNNFSSVSVELVDEVMDEIKRVPDLATKGIPQLLSDVKANLGKIIEHGSRADGIVKSMLQHSRGGTSRMEPTDLNALIKEYVNLAFHGMRASKNPFNIEIELDLDKSLGEVPLKAEDFSRVILNLCQNAFDAMRDKLQSETGKAGTYRPKLTARTRRETSRVMVQIEDNGPGIPDAIKERVLQPFFTTKKGTQGTGLGLSITNDIVKAHGGEMRIETNGGGGATFVIGVPAEIQK